MGEGADVPLRSVACVHGDREDALQANGETKALQGNPVRGIISFCTFLKMDLLLR
jgi:hypothetical protein